MEAVSRSSCFGYEPPNTGNWHERSLLTLCWTGNSYTFVFSLPISTTSLGPCSPTLMTGLLHSNITPWLLWDHVDLSVLAPTGICSNLYLWLLWGIWTSKNLLLFEKRSTSARSMVEKAVSSAREWLLAQAVGHVMRSHTSPGFEVLPTDTDVVLCNGTRRGLYPNKHD